MAVDQAGQQCRRTDVDHGKTGWGTGSAAGDLAVPHVYAGVGQHVAGGRIDRAGGTDHVFGMAGGQASSWSRSVLTSIACGRTAGVTSLPAACLGAESTRTPGPRRSWAVPSRSVRSHWHGLPMSAVVVSVSMSTITEYAVRDPLRPLPCRHSDRSG